MIIEDFVKFIDAVSSQNASEDYWYDVGVIEARSMLEEFSQEDWDLLRNLIKDKSIEWQKRAIYSFEGENPEQEVRIIFEITSTKDRELFEMCIDSLRCLVNEETKALILERREILERAQSLTCENVGIAQKIFMDFLEKIKD